ncbi:MAG: spore cortex biosynthesis protein YabQ [Clostridia bacterium]|nr:spore cortex biosynthesis protein YabQ [Clostridia bacterium]
MRDVTAQPFEALLLMHGGAVAGFVYLIVRIVRNRAGRRRVTHLCDAVFVLTGAALFAGYLFLANYGTVRGFLSAAFAFGFAAVYGLFAPLFARMTQKIRKK